MNADHVIAINAGNAHLSGEPLNLDRDQLELWLMFRTHTIQEALEFFCLGGGRKLPGNTRTLPFFRVNGYSGYEYRLGEHCRAEVGFAPLRWGGFVVHKVFIDSEGREEIWELYSETGVFQSVDHALYLDILYVDLIEMDPRCPLMSHVYNYLAHEYDQAQLGASRSRQIRVMESFLGKTVALPFHRDSAVLNLWEKAIAAESDLVLSWEERQKVLDQLFGERKKIVDVKCRAHGRSKLMAGLFLRAGDFRNRAQRLVLRPFSNIRGFTYKYTIGVLIWFLKTVKGNIGYSMALAIYGPFTFYFITQPLNPHAMWAVGRVRSAYLGASQVVSGLVGPEASVATAPPKAAEVVPPPQESLGHHLGMPLSTDFKEVDGQSWVDRMSNFKNMQIGYEENMQFAARMGRLDQMETQLNFSMIVDSTWEETERYLDQLAILRGSLKSPPGDLIKFIDDESVRTRRVEMYVWDKLLRYILDHPYVVMDQSKEQVYRDYYMGRSILLLQDMTNKLSSRESDFKKPADYKRLENIANAFQKTRVEGATIMERLKKNSKLFNQVDHTDGTALRAYMKRQWEILYLLQNKAQEASNFGLQTYTWSVRNAIWLLQSFYSAKRRELTLLFDSPAKPKEAVAREIRTQIEPLYEQLVHMMNLEFASIRPEISQRLPDDIDSRQRKILIDTIEAFVADRETVLKRMIQ
ncbi:hypothetical protein WDW37_21495 [Bdellovibrionota bacterium FG-1]